MGSLAGTPLADLVYSVAMSKILSKMRMAMRNYQLESHIELAGNRHQLVDLSFVDDVSVPI